MILLLYIILHKPQTTVMRTTLKCHSYTPIQIMLDASKWLNIQEIRNEYDKFYPKN